MKASQRTSRFSSSVSPGASQSRVLLGAIGSSIPPTRPGTPGSSPGNRPGMGVKYPRNGVLTLSERLSPPIRLEIMSEIQSLPWRSMRFFDLAGIADAWCITPATRREPPQMDQVENQLVMGTPCPACGSSDHIVLDSRPAVSSVRRRRQCGACGHRFTTYEIVSEVIPGRGISARIQIGSAITDLEGAITHLQKLLDHMAGGKEVG